MKENFFGSKLNTVLLFILIILTVIAIFIMFQDKDKYFYQFSQNKDNLDSTNAEVNRKILGNEDDLVFFSILPGDKVSGLVKFTGSVKNAYFFEANIGINVLDANKKLIKSGHGTAKGEWMTSLPVSFDTSIDFSDVPKGLAYIEIHNDNASGLPEKDKSILIPVMVE